VSCYRRILEEIQAVNNKVDRLLEIHSLEKQRIAKTDLNDDLLKLENHMRKTLLTLRSFKEADADTIARMNGEARASASRKLNELCVLGWCHKRRKGRKTVFFV